MNSIISLREVILHEDLFPKLLEYFGSYHATFLMRLTRLYRSYLDRDIYRRLIQEKYTELEGKEMIVSGSSDRSVRIYDMNGRCLKILLGHTGIVTSTAFNPEGSLIISASYDRTLRVWDSHTCRCLKILEGHDSYVSYAAFSPCGSLIVSAGGDDRTLKIWDVYAGVCLRTLYGHHGYISSAAFNSDGSLIVSASFDRTLKIWDPRAGVCLKTFEGHDSYVSSAFFNPAGSLIVSAGSDDDDRVLKIWDPETNECLKTFGGHEGFISSVAFNPEGSLVVSASFDKTLKIWDIKTFECIRTLKGHDMYVRSAVFNSLGSLIVSASYDKLLKIWDVFSGECLKTLAGHNDFVYSAAFTFNSQHKKVYNSIYDKVNFIEKKGDVLIKGNMYAQAILKYLECMALIKDDNNAHGSSLLSSLNQKIADCYFNLGNYQESLYYSEKAIVADSSNSKAQSCICESYINLQMLEEGDERLAGFLISSPNNFNLIELKVKISNMKISNV